MSAYVRTKTWIDNEAITFSDLNSIGTDLETYFDGTHLEAAQIKDRYANCFISFNLQANIGNTTVDLQHTLIAGVDIIPIKASCKAAAWVAGTLQFDILDDGVTIFAAPMTALNSATERSSSNFVGGSIVGGSVIIFRFAGDATPWNGTNVHCVLHCKTLLRA